MDDKDKIISGVLGVAGIVGAYMVASKMNHLNKKIDRLERIVDCVVAIQDIDYQKEIDERFEDIAEHFDD
jgi:hypothetical protein